MYTLLHLSDIHRSEIDPISNDDLISCLIADCKRFPTEVPPISRPDAIIVSGDIVQGLSIGSADFPIGLTAQYEQALSFLIMLAETFLQGDRSRLVIVPGNHDVDWNTAIKSMASIKAEGRDIPHMLSQQNSPFRWSWKSLELFQIKDLLLYEERMKYFRDMYEDFYQNALLTFALNPKRPWNLFALDSGRIVVCGFDSCTKNDCFNVVGAIPPEYIAQSHLELERKSVNAQLAIAVWHHDIQGPPLRSDYMDQETVRIMIDRGYRLGLHGHQHKSDASPVSVYTSQRQNMAVLSAGSLCAGRKDLPQGFNRQYNIVEISDDYARAVVHVREMNIPFVLSSGRLTAWGGKSFAEIEWTPTPITPLVDTGRAGGSKLVVLEQIESLISTRSFDKAVTLIDSAESILGHLGRQLKSKALFEGRSWKRLADHLHQPQSFEELAQCLKALVALRDWPTANSILEQAYGSGEMASQQLDELRKWLRAEKGAAG